MVAAHRAKSPEPSSHQEEIYARAEPITRAPSARERFGRHSSSNNGRRGGTGYAARLIKNQAASAAAASYLLAATQAVEAAEHVQTAQQDPSTQAGADHGQGPSFYDHNNSNSMGSVFLQHGPAGDPSTSWSGHSSLSGTAPTTGQQQQQQVLGGAHQSPFGPSAAASVAAAAAGGGVGAAAFNRAASEELQFGHR